MSAHSLNEKLVHQVQNAHAMERSVVRMLESMISTTDDVEIKEMLEHHHEETKRHEQLLAGRLEAMGEGTSTPRELAAFGGALVKGLTDQVRPGKAGKNARDAYITEHFEIATYELLERLAKVAGDQETAAVAKQNCADERRMAAKIDKNWDKFLELSLQDIAVPA
jgi:ferritin-like metal-binding protein YciE